MSEEHELPSDTDDDDEDYVPEGTAEPVSEAESEGDVESGPDDENNENKQLTKNKKNNKKRRNNKDNKIGNLKRKKIQDNSNNDDDDNDDEEDNDNESKKLTEEEEKKRADSLWADFMKDSVTTTKKPIENKIENKKTELPIIKPKIEEKVKITKIFEFAGEEVKVEKEVPIDSAEARLKLSTTELSSNSSSKKIGNNSTIRGGRRGGLGGISSILNNIGKKNKISTLEKTKLDWDNFKREEKIDEELTNYNRGKDGYLERQDFLQRTDLRQFEIEKNLRTTTRRSNR